MGTRLVIEGNTVYEIDEECMGCSGGRREEKGEGMRAQKEKQRTERYVWSPEWGDVGRRM